MNEILTYIFWPNPGNADYTSPKALALVLLCVALVVASFVLPRWRNRLQNPQMKKVSRSWAMASGWFGWTGLVLVIARVEEIQYLAMRFLWVLWAAALVAYLFVQYKLYRNRYYEVIPNQPVQDARNQYLPKRKKR